MVSWKFPFLLINGMMLLLSAHRMSRWSCDPRDVIATYIIVQECQFPLHHWGYHRDNSITASISVYCQQVCSRGGCGQMFILINAYPVIQKPVAYSVLLGGWAMIAWATSMMKDNLLHFITSYPHYFIIYIAIVGVASFLFCYWRGPITHHRSFQIIQWSIQLVAMTTIYQSTQLREASIILVTMVILFYLMHTRLLKWIKKCYMYHVVLRWWVIMWSW